MNFKIKNRHQIKHKEINKIRNKLQNNFNHDFFNSKSIVEIGEFEDKKMIFIDGEPCLMYHNNQIVFTLHGINKYKPSDHFVVVDMGAVRFVTNGADVMAPGIIDADVNINEGDQVWICDEKNHKPLAIGIAIMNGEQMIKEKKGKAVNIIHYVGDQLWNFSAKSL